MIVGGLSRWWWRLGRAGVARRTGAWWGLELWVHDSAVGCGWSAGIWIAQTLLVIVRARLLWSLSVSDAPVAASGNMP
jgi:hypothetical protein